MQTCRAQVSALLDPKGSRRKQMALAQQSPVLFSGAPDVPCELRERERNAAGFQLPPHLVHTESCLTGMSYYVVLTWAEDRWVLADIVGTRRSRDVRYNRFRILLPQSENIRIGCQLLLRLVSTGTCLMGGCLQCSSSPFTGCRLVRTR